MELRKKSSTRVILKRRSIPHTTVCKHGDVYGATVLQLQHIIPAVLRWNYRKQQMSMMPCTR